MAPKSFLAKILDGKSVIIYGFGITGKWLSGLYDIEYFVDTDKKKWGDSFGGKVVKSPMELMSINPNAIVVVTVVDIFDVVPFLNHYKIPYVSLAELLGNDGVVVENNFTSESNEFVQYSVDTVLVCQKASIKNDSLYLRSVDLVVTEKCTLKCRDCANLMQFYEDPKTYAKDFVMRGILDLASRCDFIQEVRVIGGEPFINKEIYSILDEVCSIKNIHKVVVYTNGMIPPLEEKMTAIESGFEKLIFSITDYSELGRNLEKTIGVVKKLNIPYRLHPPEHWTDSGRILDEPLAEEDASENFAKCCGKNLYTLMGNSLYRCPFAANAEQFKGIPRDSTNSVSVTGSKEQIKNYSYGISMIDACKLCPGRSFDAPIIKPAIQTRKSLPYKIYRE